MTATAMSIAWKATAPEAQAVYANSRARRALSQANAAIITHPATCAIIRLSVLGHASSRNATGESYARQTRSQQARYARLQAALQGRHTHAAPLPIRTASNRHAAATRSIALMTALHGSGDY